MRKFLAFGIVAVALAGFAATARAADPIVPFPSPTVGDVFVAAQTVAADGSLTNWFAPGSTVTFRAYAIDAKSKKYLGAKDAKYFYVTIPNAGSVKMKYDPKAAGASAQFPWTAKWNVPTSYTQGLVPFSIHVRSLTKKYGLFVQMPVTTAMLTISSSPSPSFAGAPAAQAAVPNSDLVLYIDTVNGTRPAGAAPRPVGCTQNNIFKRGEQPVFRVWGVDLSSGEILSPDNVDAASVSIPGQPDLQLPYGAHGNTGAKVGFYANAWNVPKDYPLGDVTAKVTFKTVSGKTGTYSYTISIVA
jgi:hypothetical protein